MISDNFVTGDNVYLNELKNFFFEVLGMMSITHYGCIGDGRYDNYNSLQVAIEDARRRGLCYLYVPYGRFRFRGELQHLDDVTFIGNPRAKIYNDKTGEEITILQFGVMGCCKTGAVIYLADDITLRDYVPPDLKTGIYYTGEHRVVFADEGGEVSLIGPYEIFYYNADNKTFCTPAFQLWYTDENYWWQDINSWNTSEIVDDDFKIPTSGAVYRELHPEYDELEYITSLNYQMLNTKIQSCAGIKVEMKFQFRSIDAFQSVFGTQLNGPNMNFGIDESAEWFMITNAQVDRSGTAAESEVDYEVEFYMGASEQYLKVNDSTLLSASRTIGSDVNPSTLFLFARNSSLENHSCSNIRLYYARIYQDGELVRDFVPAKRKNDDEVCLYDFVSGLYFENNGIGAFIAGPVVNS